MKEMIKKYKGTLICSVLVNACRNFWWVLRWRRAYG